MKLAADKAYRICYYMPYVRAHHRLGILLLLALGNHCCNAGEPHIRGRKLGKDNLGKGVVQVFYPTALLQTWNAAPPGSTNSNAVTGSSTSPTTTTTTSSSSSSNLPAPVSYTGATVADNNPQHPCFYLPCMHFGKCSPNGYAFVCQCQEGWGGDFCEQTIAVKVPQLVKPPIIPTIAGQRKADPPNGSSFDGQ